MYLPSIEQEGVFKLKAPFDKDYKPNTLYTCLGVRSIKELLAADIDPYAAYYQQYGIDYNEYLNDVQSNASIVSLQATTGVWIRVPSTYILGAPNNSGTKFTPLIISAYVGYVSESTNFDHIRTDIVGVIKDALGIEAEVNLTIAGPKVLLSDEDVDRISNARLAVKGQAQDPIVVNRELQEKVRKLELLNANLNAYIKANA